MRCGLVHYCLQSAENYWLVSDAVVHCYLKWHRELWMCVCIRGRRIQLTGSCCVLCYFVVKLYSTLIHSVPLVPTQIFFFLAMEDLLQQHCECWAVKIWTVMCSVLIWVKVQNKTKKKKQHKLLWKPLVQKKNCCQTSQLPFFCITLKTKWLFGQTLKMFYHNKVTYLPFRNRSVFPSPDTCLCFWVSVLHDRKDMNTKL